MTSKNKPITLGKTMIEANTSVEDIAAWFRGINNRKEPLRPNELLYDEKGQPVAIKSNGQILAIIEGDL